MLQPFNLPPRSARVQVIILAMVTLLSVPLLLLAWPEDGPSWWTQRRLFQNDVEGNQIASEDYAAANQGQLKNFAVSAYEDFLEKIPPQLGGIGDLRNPAQLPPNGGTGYRLREMVRKWVLLDDQTGAVLRNPDGTRRLASVEAGSFRNDFAALNLGQLKAVAKPFYDRLLELNANESEWLHPWNVDGGKANDFAPANLGQLKRVFSFDVKKDDDGDGLGNLEEMNWQAIHGGSRNYDPNNPDMDEDGVLDGAEVAAGTDPLEFYNGSNPVIRISAPHNKGLRNTVLEMPVAVRVYRKVVTGSGAETAGEFLKNAPVSISVNMGSIALEENAPVEGWSVAPLDTKTDWNGWALVWVRLPDVIGKKCALTVRALNQTLQFPLETFPQLPPPVFGEVYEGMDGIVEVKAGVSGGVTTDVPITSTPGLKIHYRVDDPGVTESSASTYSPGLVIAGTGNHTVHARAYAPGFEPSIATSKLVSAPLYTPENLGGKLPAYGMVSVMTAWVSPLVISGSNRYFPFGYARFRPQSPDSLTGLLDLPLQSGWYGASAAGYASPGRDPYYQTAHPYVKPSAMGGVVTIPPPSILTSFKRTMAYGYDFNTKPFTVFYVSALHNLHKGGVSSLFGAGDSLFQFGTTKQLIPSSNPNSPEVFRFGRGTLDANIAPMSTLARPSQARENQNFIAEISWDGQNVEGFYNGLRQYKHPHPLSRYGSNRDVFVSTADKDFVNSYSEFACAVVYNRKLSQAERAKVYAVLYQRQQSSGPMFVTQPPTVKVPSKPTLEVPYPQDADRDWLPDWRETELGTSSTSTDSDRDGISDYAEACIFFTDPTGNDTDGDRMLDREEALLKGVNPYVSDGSADSDGDGLSNFKEVLLKTNPVEKDSDGDGFEDGYELNNGSNPAQHGRMPYLPITSVSSHGNSGGPNGGGNGDGGGDNDNEDGDTYPGGDESGTNPGIPSPAGGSVSLKLGVGDVSSSHSEDYEIIAREKVAGADWAEFFRHRSGGKGKYEEATYQIFSLENEYSFEIHRISGSDSGSDFDYRMVVAVDNTVPNPFNSRAFVLDPENILCDPEPESLTTVDGYLTATGADTDSLPDQRYNVTEEWINGSKKVKLLPIEMTLHHRGTIRSPGSEIPRPTNAEDVYEVIMLENADWEEQGNWVPNSMASASEVNRQDGATQAVNLNRDDDFVKIRLYCPVPKIAGDIELVMDRSGQGERMEAEDIRFYNEQGHRIHLADLRIENLQNPTGPLAPMLEKDGLNLFVEIADLGQLTRLPAEANRDVRRYADLVLRLRISGVEKDLDARIYRGGYWKNQRNGNVGTTSFYDGKGRYQDQNGVWQVDVGRIIHGPYNMRSGIGTQDETVTGRGPTPVGWYGLYERTDFRTVWDGRSRPQTNHTIGQNGRPLGYLQQGSYCQWEDEGNRDGQHQNGAYQHSGDNPPDSIQFKFELLPWGHDAHGRTFLQIHPDGFNDGTSGCVGIQTYDDCCHIFFLHRHYFGTKMLVEIP